MQAPLLLQKLFPSITWRIPDSKNSLYLTFDDGPIPVVTPWVLETLDKYNAKATFFCIGQNVKRYPEIYREIISRGHQTGNHTHRHLNGWNVKNKNYFADVSECSNYVHSTLFRPPYGKIKPSQIRELKKNYQLVMWDVLSQDYDEKRTAGQCSASVIRESKPGSIIVFHDSIKAESRLRGSLPTVLEHFIKKGFEFTRLESSRLHTR